MKEKEKKTGRAEATVIGRIHKAEKRTAKNDKGREYLQLTIAVAGGRRGDILAFGKLYDTTRANVEAFLASYKESPHARFKFHGAINQFESRETAELMTGFAFFGFRVAFEDEPEAATFVIEGLPDGMSAHDDQTLRINVTIPLGDGQEKRMQLYVTDNIRAGRTIYDGEWATFAGAMRDPLSAFGGASNVLPMVERLILPAVGKG